MKRIGLPLAAILTAVGLTLSACGGAPSKDDLSESLAENGDLPEDLADCIAEELLDSDLSDDQLNAFVDDEDDLPNDDEGDIENGEAEALAAFMEAAGACATE